MKERPILFSAPMVRAILSGTKTQTRRIYRPKAGYPRQDGEILPDGSGYMGWDEGPCPYGAAGDRLWVRETWASDDGRAAWYRADGETHNAGLPWRPSIHMPRWASRLTLEVTGIRVERLQDISEEDAKAEGALEICDICGNPPEDEVHWACEADYVPQVSHRVGFQDLWESINSPGSWGLNPWVWVVGFRRLP